MIFIYIAICLVIMYLIAKFKKKRIKVILFFLLLFIVHLVINKICEERNMKLSDKEMLINSKEITNRTKKINIVVGNESLGVPSSSKTKKEFGELISEALTENGADVEYINFSSMRINKTWHLISMLQHNISIKQVKEIQSFGIDDARKGLGILKIFLPEKVKKNYHIEEGDESIYLNDVVSSDNTILIISSGANDIMHKLHADPVSYVLKPSVRKTVKERRSIVISYCVSNMKDKIEKIKYLKGDNQIYLLSLYTPFGSSGYADIIKEYNKEMKKLCDFEGIFFVDISNAKKHLALPDFHPNQVGHYYIANEVLKSIKDNLGNFEEYPIIHPDNEGIEGMIEDQEKVLSNVKKSILPEKEMEAKVDEYISEIELFEKVSK